MTTKEKQLIEHCLNAMMSTEQIQEMLKEYGYNAKGNKSGIIDAALNECGKLNINSLTKYLRDKWTPTNIQTHIDNMKSGKLKGHDWHGAMPSSLHLSLQNKVRECVDGLLSIDKLIEIGADIMKHEYFMVAQHDIIETSIISHFKNTIPPIVSRSITDFVFKDIPVDLKVTGFPDKPEKWQKRAKIDKKLTEEEKICLIKDLYERADKDRMRKQAQKTVNNWGLNRMYIIIKNQDEWFKDPESIVGKVIKELEKTEKPYNVTVNGFPFEAFCIEV